LDNAETRDDDALNVQVRHPHDASGDHRVNPESDVHADAAMVVQERDRSDHEQRPEDHE